MKNKKKHATCPFPEPVEVDLEFICPLCSTRWITGKLYEGRISWTTDRPRKENELICGWGKETRGQGVEL